ncbi:cell division protein FtsQ [Candidatus Poribacteria bacterium]|nr:cell division protein FtsQ [Candidatus Poribacteria bacterium]
MPCREDSGSFMVVDNNGILLEELKGDVRFTGPYLNMPVIIGVDEVVLKNRKGEIPEVDTALEVISKARVSIPELFNQISYIDSREPEDIKLYLQNPGLSSRTELKIRLAKDRIKEGLEDVLPVVKKIRLDRKEVEYIDLRFPGAVYCMDVEKPDNAVINQMTGKSGTESHIR